MKTPRPDHSTSSGSTPASRHRRTRSAFDCESLEGRQLMTSFAVAPAAMRAPGPVDVAGMSGQDQARPEDIRLIDRAGGASSDGGGSTQGDPATGIEVPGDRATMMATKGMGEGHPGGDIPLGPNSERPMFEPPGDAGTGKFEGFTGPEGMPGWWGRGGHDEIPMNNRGDAGDTEGTRTVDDQLSVRLTRLRTDMQAILDKSQVTPALLASVRKDLAAIDAAKTGEADPTALKTLRAAEQTVFASQDLPTDDQQAHLQADRDAVLRSQGVSQALIDQLVADRLAVKTASNFTSDDQATLDADQKAIDEARRAASSQGTATSAGSQSTPSTAAATATAMKVPSTPGEAITDPALQPAPATAATTGGVDPRLMQATATAAPVAAQPTTLPTRRTRQGRPNFGPARPGRHGGLAGPFAQLGRGLGGNAKRGAGR